MHRHVGFKRLMLNSAHRHVGFKRFCVEETQLLCTSMLVLCDSMYWESILVRKHVSFKRMYGLRAHLLCIGMWVLRD